MQPADHSQALLTPLLLGLLAWARYKLVRLLASLKPQHRAAAIAAQVAADNHPTGF